jgi:hypothetical protein
VIIVKADLAESRHYSNRVSFFKALAKSPAVKLPYTTIYTYIMAKGMNIDGMSAI